MKIFFTTTLPLLFLAITLLFGLPADTLAQSADFDWKLINSGGQPEIQIEAEEDGDEYNYQWQLIDNSGEVLVDQISESNTLFLSGANMTPGLKYELTLTLRDRMTNSDLDTSPEEDVALPLLTVNNRCIRNMYGYNVEVTVDLVPKMSFFSNLEGAEVTLFEKNRRKTPVSGLPHIYPVGQSNREYRAEVSFENPNDLQLSSETVSIDCEKEEEEDEPETAEVNFGYEVNDSEVAAFVLWPTEGEYGYGWDTDGDGEIDAGGPSFLGNFETEGVVSLSLIITQDGNEIGRKAHSFQVPGNYQDSDGDGNPDGNNDEDDSVGDLEGDELDDDDSPEFSSDGGLVTCINNCGWEQFLDLIDRLIVWMIGFATVVATLLFMYAGFLYLTAGGKEGQVDQAKGILTNTAIGFGVILLAWLIVSSVVSLLTTDEWRDKNEEFLPIEFSYELEEDRLQL